MARTSPSSTGLSAERVRWRVGSGPNWYWQLGIWWWMKSAASAFFPGRCPLPDMLTRRGIDTVLVCGLVTNVCVESTARDAATLGYRVVVAADGCATYDTVAHNASLTTVYRSFGDVRSTAEIRARLAVGETTR